MQFAFSKRKVAMSEFLHFVRGQFVFDFKTHSVFHISKIKMFIRKKDTLSHRVK